jgi:hypothetical protein
LTIHSFLGMVKSTMEADMGDRMLSRSEFCMLAGLEVEQFNALRRRDQIPIVPNTDLPEEVANERGYTPTGALLLIGANEFVDRYEMSRDCAARIASYGLRMFKRWDEISAGSAQLAAGKQPALDVLFGMIDWPGVARDTVKNRSLQKVAVGTLKEIVDQHPSARDIIAISLTRCAALMRQRAAKARINLDEFWES